MIATDSKLRRRHIEVDSASLHVIEGGAYGSPPLVFLAESPEAAEWWGVLMLAAGPYHVLAFDPAGIAPADAATEPSRSTLARVVFQAVRSLGLEAPALVGHDAGGLVVHSYLRDFAARAAVIVNSELSDAEEPISPPIETPILYLRGARSPGDVAEHAERFRRGGLLNLDYRVIAGAGPFAEQESPETTWEEIDEFLRVPPSSRITVGRP